MPVATRTSINCLASARRVFARRLAARGHARLRPVVEVSERGGRVDVDCRLLGAAGVRSAHIRISLDTQQPVAWIGDLHVEESRRCAGIGTALATAAEEIAQEHSAEAIGVFPLTGSLPFWRRLRYVAHPRRSRVLFKPLAPS